MKLSAKSARTIHQKRRIDGGTIGVCCCGPFCWSPAGWPSTFQGLRSRCSGALLRPGIRGASAIAGDASGGTRLGSLGLDPLQLAPELLDLVAQLGRVLEAQLVGREEHLLLELDHRLRDLLGRHLLLIAPPAALALRDLRLDRQEVGDVRDSLD